MTKDEAYRIADKIVGPAGNINPPIRLLPDIRDALMEAQEQAVVRCLEEARPQVDNPHVDGDRIYCNGWHDCAQRITDGILKHFLENR